MARLQPVYGAFMHWPDLPDGALMGAAASSLPQRRVRPALVSLKEGAMPRTNTAAVRHRQADPEIEPEPFSPKRHPRAGLKAVDAPKQNLAIEEIAAFAHLRPCDHVVVLGKESLDLALRLWRSGFTNVGCAPRNLDKVAHGGADALIIDHLASGEDFAAAIARNRSFVRRGG
ncbi:MAG TPA: hypothetical protein PK706_25630, partial [Xanthobacteraceae bacterium]|nr:hypothetical protein [Xanthobacteraceae bacterium]